MATGLILIATESDTKKLHTLTGCDKSYITTIDLSKMSDTRDAEFWKEYTSLDAIDFSVQTQAWIADDALLEQKCREFLDSLIPTAHLQVPYFCAKKINGDKMYDYARKGELIVKYEDMIVSGYKIISCHYPEIQVEISVGSGTYIRSLAYALGQYLGSGGILTALRRTRIGDFVLAEQVLDQVAMRDEIEINFGVCSIQKLAIQQSDS